MILPPLVAATLVRRRQRFLADVILPDGSEAVAHCPNTGSMLGCADPGMRVWLSHSDKPTRKYALGWELVEALPGLLVGIHTGRANGLVREAAEAGLLPELAGLARIRPEVRYGTEGSRADFLFEGAGQAPCLVEVKNVTAAVAGGVALFPDAVSARGTRHLRELSAIAAGGGRSLLVFCVQRSDVTEVRPADAIDPAYGRALRTAMAAGVQVVALVARVAPGAIVLERRVPVVCPA